MLIGDLYNIIYELRFFETHRIINMNPLLDISILCAKVIGINFKKFISDIN